MPITIRRVRRIQSDAGGDVVTQLEQVQRPTHSSAAGTPMTSHGRTITEK